jgi:hypothetical protein
MDYLTSKNCEFVEIQNLKQSISKEVLEKFLESSKSLIYSYNPLLENIVFEEIEMVKNENPEFTNARIKIVLNPINLISLELLKKENIPGFEDQKIHLKYILSSDKGLVIDIQPKEDEEIIYLYEYHNMIIEDFERAPGSEGLIYKNREEIEKQKGIVGYLIKKIGANLLTGKSIMNVSLPISLSDVRSLLEV